MKSIYLIDLGTSEHVLFTEEKVLLNQYIEGGCEYNAFENAMLAFAEVGDIAIVEVTMSQDDNDVVSEMFTEMNIDGTTPTLPIVEYIRAHATKNG